MISSRVHMTTARTREKKPARKSDAWFRRYARERTDGRTHDHHAVGLEHRAAPQLGRRVQLTKLLERPLHFRIRLEHPAK